MSEIERLSNALIKLKKTKAPTFVYETERLEKLLKEISELRANTDSKYISEQSDKSIIHGGKF